MSTFNEQQYFAGCQSETIHAFLKMIERYDTSLSDELLSKGYVKKNTVARTVIFSFGEVTFYRSRWYKDNKCYIPVDDYLGLDKHSRYSKEFMYQVACMATYLPYRKVVEVIELLCHVYITKDVVLKAVKLAGKLLDEQEDYRFYEEEESEKREVDVLYIEGDGLLVKSSEESSESHHVELAHFVVHEGSQKIGINRWGLKHKKEFIAMSYSDAKEALIDYLYTHYHTRNTILITNSDCGKGYSYRAFYEIAKALRFKRHEHFWDAYHVHQEINTMYKNHSIELREKVYDAIFSGNKELLNAILTTTEGNILDDEETAVFQRFSQKLLSRFNYLIPPFLRGLKQAGIGVMESQHRKITYRMKKRGMYWSKFGCDTMAKMIIKVYDKTLKELFFGTWREDYVYYRELEENGVGSLKPNKLSNSSIPTVHIDYKKLRENTEKARFFV